MKKKLTHNLGLKLIAVLFACCLWLISVNINDPISQRVYTVAVQFINMNTLTDAGKHVEILDNSDSVRVTVRASRSVFSDFSEKNLVAVADVSKLTADNRLPIEVTTTKSEGKIESIVADKEYAEVMIENIMKLQKRISVKVANEPAEGYLLGNISTDQNAVIISGPESIVSRVASTSVEINVDGAASDVNITLPVHLYDADGREIDDAKLTKSVNEVFTTASILQTKEVPIQCLAVGSPAEGYLFVGRYTVEPSSVIVAAKPSTLKNVNVINVEGVLDLDGADKDVTAEVELKHYLPDNTILADGQSSGVVSLTAKLEREVTKTIEVPLDKIRLTNVPDGYTAKFRGVEDIVLVKFGGYAENLNSIDANTLTGSIDLGAYFGQMGDEFGITAGSYYPTASFDLPEYVYVKDGGTVHIVLEEE